MSPSLFHGRSLRDANRAHRLLKGLQAAQDTTSPLGAPERTPGYASTAILARPVTRARAAKSDTETHHEGFGF
jgi:hypothetical protein